MYIIEEVKNMPFHINIRESILAKFKEKFEVKYFKCKNKNETILLKSDEYPDLVFSILNTETGLRKDYTWSQTEELADKNIFDLIIPNTKVYHSVFDGCDLYDGLSVLRWIYKGVGFKFEKRNDYYFIVFDNGMSYTVYQGQLREGLDAFKRDLAKITLLT